MPIKHVISVSGGKDSAATLSTALERFSRASIIPIFCDTGNEHEAVYEYLNYLELALGIHIVRLKANFDSEIANKRIFIARDARTKRQYDTAPVWDADGVAVPKRDGRGNIMLSKKGEPVQKTKKIGGGRKSRWTNKAKRRALAVLHPTDNPFLDLCIWKGRFPSRKAQFCTEQLKRDPAVEFQMALVDAGYTVVSWQGVRRDESMNRRNAKKFESIGPGMYIYRPIVDWTAPQVFSYCSKQGISVNPLYLQGMGRVGCMPCINASKKELQQIGRRFISHIGRIFSWEVLVGLCSKRGSATFMPAPSRGAKVLDQFQYAKDNNIYSIIEWANTTRGGKQFDLFGDLEEVTACSSVYGLCE